ncbi:hypothetical protein EON80_09030, partial [bacterium]
LKVSLIRNLEKTAQTLNKLVNFLSEENKGQITGTNAESVRYSYRRAGLSIFLLHTGIAYQFTRVHYPEGYPTASDLMNPAMAKRMEALLPDAEKSTAAKVTPQYEQKPADLVRWSRVVVANKLAETDPAAAFAMGDDLQDYDRAQLYLKVGRYAVKLGQNELATKSLRASIKVPFAPYETGALAATVALEYDPQLADEFFEKGWDAVKPRPDQEATGFDLPLVPYVQARAGKWAGESRILIEREWARLLPKLKPDDEQHYYQQAENLKTLVGAMALIDPLRAVEMAEQLPTEKQLRAEAKSKLMVGLLSSKN